ncbi:MAG TPA: serine hydrolase [Burkholderiales bacterium]|nr:serine hydrolase [Burkholderiales bacterium]
MPRPGVILFVAVLATARVCSAQLASIQSIDRELQRKAEAGQFSGSVLIAKGGRILLDKGYGRAAYPAGPENTGATRFRIGSLTKQFTAAAILELRDEGRLSLDDAVCRYLQPCPDTWGGIKLFHLLSHTSGIPSYTRSAGYEEIKAHPLPTASLMRLIESLPLQFAPGSAFDYGDSGYAVLGAVIEQASGTSYPEFLNTKILDPLEMTDSACADLPASDASAQGYSPAADGLHPALVVDASVAFSSAGMYSTTRDLLRWARALMDGRILSDRSRQEMFTAGREDFGYGWIVPKNTSPAAYLHLGALAGFESAIFVLPELRVSAIVLSNIEGTDAQSLAASNAIAGAYAEYEGDYALPELKKTLRVFLKGGTLKAQTTRGPTLALEYVSGDRFVALRATESEVRIEFTRDDAGQVVGVEAEQFGKRFSGVRKPAPGTSAGSTPRYAQRLAAEFSLLGRRY